jgi:CheY-specific phosphatase CheX
MNSKISKTMSHVAIETLEQLAFIFSSPLENVDMLNHDATAASVSFSGPFSGRLMIKIDTAPVRELVSNMLGTDEDEINEEQKYDAIKETLNILCGNLLPEIAGDQDIFSMKTPYIVSKEEQAKNDKEGPFAATTLSIDDEKCSLYLFVDGDIPEGSLAT